MRITLAYKGPRQQQKQEKAEMESHWSTDSDSRRVLHPCKLRKKIANWTWVELGSLEPQFNSLEVAENYWQRQNENTENETER